MNVICLRVIDGNLLFKFALSEDEAFLQSQETYYIKDGAILTVVYLFNMKQPCLKAIRLNTGYNAKQVY